SEETIRAQARAYREAAPKASIFYGTKAFANVELIRVLADEGVGADVSTAGELAFALEAGVPGERILFHGNNKSDEELRAAAVVDATVVLDAPDEPDPAAAAGVTLYRVGVVKESGGVSYVAIDGGMSDNPRPQLYGARYEALLANRANELPDGVFRIAGKHCESGDVLIDAIALPRPRRGDVLAVPATGAYTLAMGSNYNGVPRPAVVLVGDGGARLIRERETVGDLLRFERS